MKAVQSGLHRGNRSLAGRFRVPPFSLRPLNLSGGSTDGQAESVQTAVSGEYVTLDPIGTRPFHSPRLSIVFLRDCMTERAEYPSRSERSEREYGVSCASEGFRRGEAGRTIPCTCEKVTPEVWSMCGIGCDGGDLR